MGTEFCYLPRSRPRDLPTVSPVYGPRYVKSDRLSQPEVQWKMVPGRAPGKTPAGNMVSAVEVRPFFIVGRPEAHEYRYC